MIMNKDKMHFFRFADPDDAHCGERHGQTSLFVWHVPKCPFLTVATGDDDKALVFANNTIHSLVWVVIYGHLQVWSMKRRKQTEPSFVWLVALTTAPLAVATYGDDKALVAANSIIHSLMWIAICLHLLMLSMKRSMQRRPSCVWVAALIIVIFLQWLSMAAARLW